MTDKELTTLMLFVFVISMGYFIPTATAGAALVISGVFLSIRLYFQIMEDYWYD